MHTLVLLAVAAYALAGPAGAVPAPHGVPSKVITRHGPVTLLNHQSAALRVRGPGGTKIVAIGTRLTLRAEGTYRITLVRQTRGTSPLTLRIT
jgi:hypothetical protein